MHGFIVEEMNMDKRKDWVTRQYVEIGLQTAKDEGRTAGARYMANHKVPIAVALRVLRGV